MHSQIRSLNCAFVFLDTVRVQAQQYTTVFLKILKYTTPWSILLDLFPLHEDSKHHLFDCLHEVYNIRSKLPLWRHPLQSDA